MYKFFINRPIVAMVLAILTVIVGLVSMTMLPIAQYPEIVPPQITVNATYVGADAITIEESTALPIEQQMSGVEGMEYMTSTSSNNGLMNLTVTFDVETDTDTDQILTQMRVSQAQSQVPTSVTNQGIVVKKSLASPLVMFALTSPDDSLDSLFLANYAVINLNDAFTRIGGVASVTVFGSGNYAMRIWVDPNVLASRNITVSEIINAIQSQNTVNPAGKIGGDPVPAGQEFTYTVSAQGRLTEPEQFADIIVRANPDGSVVRVKDIARIELGSQTYTVNGVYDGKPSAILALYQTPGSNALQAAEDARSLMEEAAKSFPDGMEYTVALDTTEAVTAGIEEIKDTLFEALVLVVIVVFIFLQGWRATLIPLIAVPVSLIGTFIFFPILGFSINTLSLFGLVLAIGLVVDDAIVVVEAVERYIEEGFGSKEATMRAMKDVSGPIFGTSMVLVAVFVPTIFIPGITGRLYQQFAVTIAVSVLISTFNALTLSPALSALLLRPRKKAHGPLGWFYGKFNLYFGKATGKYVAICGGIMRKSILAIGIIVIVGGIGGYSASRLSSGFIPDEDQGYLFASMNLPAAASLERTTEVNQQVYEVTKDIPGIEHTVTVAGFNLLSGVQNTYSSFIAFTLKPWSYRYSSENVETMNLKTIYKEINERIQTIPGATGFAFPPPAIPGIGASGGVTFILQDRGGRSPEFLQQQTERFIEAATANPAIGSASTNFSTKIPQIYVDVDKDKVLKQGVPLSSVYQTLQTFMGGAFVNYFNRFGRQWQVYVQAEGAFRTDIANLDLFYVRNNAGDPVPLNVFTTPEKTHGPEYIRHYDIYRSTQLNVTAADGYSSGDAMAALEETFAETMDSSMGFSYSGMSYEEKKAADGVSPTAIFALSLTFVFLILAALYESWSLPFSVLISLPIAVGGAFIFLDVRDFQNNVYAQIGLVMLIGLAAKNAILIVEYGRAQYLEEGKSLREAALEAARLRLRPILMTSFAFILGCMPLYFALGAGMNSRRILGTTVIGGMLAASVISILVIPSTFYMIEKIGHRKHKDGDDDHDEPAKAIEPPKA
ncbi:efflux RND transporter permease subunit [Puniceicoccus vermicola]|uniref:Efflux RND transporter permease subunit n=1 Tax=Puniceicoccus vermicola TaxID=388746 RepID=A0A7X1AXD3_9BACT|nr:efflux RND transporter permease subunit [Puniceicoccus vermicola]MBC2601677.1 efflux RND transporter permease subunit [Puniceicoccus vermicola]